MIKTITKFFAVATILKNLLETKKGDITGNTQIHPSKFPGRTIFVREKEYFIRESYVNHTVPIVFYTVGELTHWVVGSKYYQK